MKRKKSDELERISAPAKLRILLTPKHRKLFLHFIRLEEKLRKNYLANEDFNREIEENLCGEEITRYREFKIQRDKFYVLYIAHLRSKKFYISKSELQYVVKLIRDNEGTSSF